nr:odorant receptor 30a-like [Leptinotarsa decemlineata]
MFLVQVFYMYFHANELILKSKDIGSCVYKSNWYEQSPSVKSTLFITMIRTNKPLCLHIGNMDVMSNVVLIKIMKAGYTYILLANK